MLVKTIIYLSLFATLSVNAGPNSSNLTQKSCPQIISPQNSTPSISNQQKLNRIKFYVNETIKSGWNLSSTQKQSNTATFNKITQTVHSLAQMSANEQETLWQIRQDLIAKVSHSFKLQGISDQTSQLTSYSFNTPQISTKVGSLAAAVAAIDSAINIDIAQPANDPMALNNLIMMAAHNFNQFIDTFPVLRSTFLTSFNRYTPTFETSFEDFFKLFQALASGQVIVPQSWHSVSMQAFESKLEVLSTETIVKHYKNLLFTGVPISTAVENKIHLSLSEQKQNIDENVSNPVQKEKLLTQLDNLTSDFAQSITAAMAFYILQNNGRVQIQSGDQLSAITESLEQFNLTHKLLGVGSSTNKQINMLYIFAQVNFDLFDNFETPEVKPKSTNNQLSKIERTVKNRIEKLFQSFSIQKKQEIVQYMPPVGLYDATNNLIIEVDGPRRNNIVLQSNAQTGTLTLRNISRRVIDILTEATYIQLGLQHVRINSLVEERGNPNKSISDLILDSLK